MNRLPFAALACLCLVACNTTGPRNYLVLENDMLRPGSTSDDNYTSGMRFGHLEPLDEVEERGTQSLARWMRGIGERVWQEDLSTRQHLIDFSINQSQYTPKDKANPDFIPDDRPYAAHLDFRFALHSQVLADNPEGIGDRLVTTEIGIGMVGPAALGSETQNLVHDIIGSVDTRAGWEHQLGAEPTLQLTTSRLERHARLGHYGFGMDVSSRFTGALGTVHVYGSAGFEVRAGYNLGRDFGPASFHQSPALSFQPVPDREERRAPEHSLVLSGGMDVRGVAHNLFLDGGTFQDGPAMDRYDAVRDFHWGLEYRYRRWFARWVQVTRSREFAEYEEQYHRFGSLQFGWHGSF
ncbi:MAG: lipid A deacylase LpxR family protein [Planctomycetota bacterium]